MYIACLENAMMSSFAVLHTYAECVLCSPHVKDNLRLRKTQLISFESIILTVLCTFQSENIILTLLRILKLEPILRS
jgi:hypothetical protein